MNKTVRLLTDVAAGLSATAWISGPMFEELAIKPASANASPEATEAMYDAYKAYSNVVHAGLAGLAIVNALKFFSDDLRKKGTNGYKAWARIGDLVVLSIISVGAATRIMSKRVKTGTKGSSEVEQATQVLGVTGKISIGLALALLFVSGQQYRERAASAKLIRKA